MDLEPAEHGFGFYGPRTGYPQAGLCLSVFLAVHREGRLLTGQMDQDHADTWEDRWAPNLAVYDGERRDRLFEGWRFPATYLREGEAPAHAAQRVWEDQLALDRDPDLGNVRVHSSAQPSRSSEGRHWDVVFVYRDPGPADIQAPPHWTELAYRDPEALGPDEAVMLHGQAVELLRA